MHPLKSHERYSSSEDARVAWIAAELEKGERLQKAMERKQTAQTFVYLLPSLQYDSQQEVGYR